MPLLVTAFVACLSRADLGEADGSARVGLQLANGSLKMRPTRRDTQMPMLAMLLFLLLRMLQKIREHVLKGGMSPSLYQISVTRGQRVRFGATAPAFS